mmetsp:Transcript_111157/g.321306  ORF Transcript_111157/g.321306 Transcript_111157/m.321306 type:complete len:223 (+) Transcript_111157:101-769(+)|eukprot:CAMPEP_0176073384 /NCGR_PEP_ID=MMETSP0120_2-20121206/36667_1 /TAXON_ID=160619 /ORGANISM="Kryptoperidinium foliaceum, Strain CCMP 1326" /LENGTH=222 /DNA_ID=CAMNT_0017407067 /DNA_START=95 /DNA_END=763 /DNA_ORIENTATION=+
MVAKRKSITRSAGVSKKAPGKDVKLTKAGQPFLSCGRCICTTLKGHACCKPVGAPAVPYCKDHMRSGDPSFRVVKHPKAGKILVAARDLPRGYRVSLWGLLKRKKDVTAKAMEWAFDITGGWFIDPTKCHGSLVQFCPCPGPNEAAALNVLADSMCKGGKYGSWGFILGQPLPKNWQVTLQYGNTGKESEQFFKERGIDRLDVGTTSHPALRRKDAPPVKKH